MGPTLSGSLQQECLTLKMVTCLLITHYWPPPFPFLSTEILLRFLRSLPYQTFYTQILVSGLQEDNNLLHITIDHPAAKLKSYTLVLVTYDYLSHLEWCTSSFSWRVMFCEPLGHGPSSSSNFLIAPSLYCHPFVSHSLMQASLQECVLMLFSSLFTFFLAGIIFKLNFTDKSM